MYILQSIESTLKRPRSFSEPSLEGNHISTSRTVSPELPAQTRQSSRDSLLSQPTFAPYTDDPELGPAVPPEPATLLQVQRLVMDGEGPLSI